MKVLTDLFDYSCCINLDKRPDRWEKCTEEFNKWNINDVHRISAIDAEQISQTYPNVYQKSKFRNWGHIGLILTNIQIFEYAKEQKFSQILIMEDDVYFTPEVNNIESLMLHVPKDWDMFYVGGNHNIKHPVRPQPLPINQHVVKCQHTFTTHCYAVKSHMYDILISRLNLLDAPIDVIYTDIQKSHNVYGFYPSVAKQRESFSDIEQRVRNYDNLIT